MEQKVNIHIFHECKGEHSHAYPQILVPLEEAVKIRVGDAEYEVTPQELCFVPSGMVHQCNYVGKLLVLNLSQDMAEQQDAVLLSSPLIVSMRGQILQLVDLIQTELKQNPNSNSVRYLYNYLYSKLLENCAAPSIRYISEYYHLPITVNQLAKIESYNVTYYSDWFKQQTGFSPSFYLRCMRINRAKELLTSTNFSVMEIAVMVGYSSNSTFTRAFHNITGMTPKAYRDCPCFQHIG
ncbi:MAG: AraC family transcriptional regulator [Butyricicoccus sp.]|nr:AraC family transcriptional regulator [Butyricicoccus sp.]